MHFAIGETFRVKHFHQHQNFSILSTLMQAKTIKGKERRENKNTKSLHGLDFVCCKSDHQFQRLAKASSCTLPIKEVIWSPELAYLTVVLGDSVTKEQLESVAPPTQDFPSLEPTKKVAGLTLTCPGDQTHDFYSRQVSTSPH